MSEYNPAGGGGGDISKADLAQNVEWHGIIWGSGSTFYGKNTKTNLVVASGLDAGHVISRTIAEVGSGFAGQQINVKLTGKDTYAFTSGIFISGANLRLIGEGPEKTLLDFSNPTSKVSGCMVLTGHDQEVGQMTLQYTSGFWAGILSNGRAALKIHDILMNGPGETISGVFGVRFGSCSSSFIKNMELYSFNDGIFLLSSQANHIEDIYGEGFGTLVKLIGSSTNQNTVEFINATATSYLSGIVGIISGADNNVIHSVHSAFEAPCVYLDSNSGTNRNKISDITNIDNSGITILDNSPGKNFIGAYYPEVGIGDVQRFTIWVSGGIYQGLRNNDGIIIASGTNAANVFKTVMDSVGSPAAGGLVHVKTGDYSFTSGWSIRGAVTLYGDPGEGTTFSFDSASGMISGAIRISGVRAALRDVGIYGLSGVNPVIYTVDTTVEITDVDIDSNTGTPYSGLIGIHMAGGRGDSILRNVNVQAHDTGIYIASGSNGIFQASEHTIIDNARVGNGRCGILLDASVANIITNVIGDSSLTSGTVRLINMSNNNVIDNIIGEVV